MDFHNPPAKDFWRKFPSRPIPYEPRSKIDSKKFESMLREADHLLTRQEKMVGQKALKSLQEGAKAYQKTYLPAAALKNASSAAENGAAVTKKIAEWIQTGFVAGPFHSPPLKDFRSNSIMVDVQKGKPRLIVNMSYPKGASFNDNIDKDMVPRLTMSSARQFGQSVLTAGKGALMSKIDMKDAFKLIPAAIKDLRLQGFKWLGAYFIETQQIFGAATSVASFDQMAGTILLISIYRSKIPRHLVHRTLDDVACAAPPNTGWCQEFTKNYKEACTNLGINLAEDCPNLDKAFSNSTRGTVLGIQFDSNKLAWRLPTEKMTDILEGIHTAINGGHLDLKQAEKLAGRLNNLGQMCPYLHAFKRPLNKLLADFKEDYNILLPVTTDLTSDLKVWAAAAMAANTWLPIHKELAFPPLGAASFTSDAAGCASEEEWTGVASVSFKDKKAWFVCQGTWPKSVQEKTDEKGAKFSSKMTTLELIGLFLPLLSIPNELKGCNVVLGVDNVSVVFGWENKTVKGDLTASALVRALSIVSSFLHCRIFVEHAPRVADQASKLADDLSRASTATAEVMRTTSTARKFGMPPPITSWLSELNTDWDLGFKMVEYLKETM